MRGACRDRAAVGTDHESETHTVRVRRVPRGVVAAIVPWNLPIMLAVWKIAPALLTGDTVVLKPSPFTSLTGLRIGELLSTACRGRQCWPCVSVLRARRES
ncbi:aldehyde dehydrogenase family protein [Nocardia xishanensis]|uniref:Aldehyde dehydrogenase family protein n=1 Tax=Nocardia xishanensis TaxID=238964 RepID=A0ABW7XC27_9NOCA